MKITSDQKLVNSTEETLEIKISFNPQNQEEEGLVAMIATIVDLTKNYHRLNTLVDNED